MRPCLLLSLTLLGCPSAIPANDDDATASATATLNAPIVFTAGGAEWPSCAQLDAIWSLDGPVQLTLTDTTTGAEETRIAAGGTARFDDLKSVTEYTLSVALCPDVMCSAPGEVAAAASATTGEQVWQYLGTGADLDGLTNSVADSNAKAHAIAYGADAPTELAGRVQLYYGATNGLGGSLSVATSNGPIDRDELSTLTDFTSFAGGSGLVQPDTAAPLVEWIGTGSATPLADRVRLFFEARGGDGTTRILSLDSVDGLTGRDFHDGTATFCSETADYGPGGGCEPDVLLGVQGDAVNPVSNAWAVRQHKIGVPTLDDWRWDAAAGTFMLFTVNLNTACPASDRAHGYALWDGATWIVDADGGCPKLFDGAQAMAPLHRGGGRFEAQFGIPGERDGAVDGSPLPFLGPKRVIYGEPDRTGDPAVLEFEDWDTVGAARDVTFLWPDGSVLDAAAEGYIDDFVLLHPTLEADFVVRYDVITDGARMPFTAVAVLMNQGGS